MARTILTARDGDKRMLRLARRLVADFRVATDPEFIDTPIIREQIEAFNEVASLHRQLMARGLSHRDVLARLRDWCSDLKMPLLDAMRLRNGLTTTFGQQVVADSVERELRPG